MDIFQRTLLLNQITIMKALAGASDPILEKELDERIEATEFVVKNTV